MSTDKESEVLSMLQPDLLTEKELIQKIRSEISPTLTSASLAEGKNASEESVKEAPSLSLFECPLVTVGLSLLVIGVAKKNLTVGEPAVFEAPPRPPLPPMGWIPAPAPSSPGPPPSPTPQTPRFYRTNRRGKMLTSRRAKAGLESKRKEEGFAGVPPRSGASSSGDRLKPPPDVSGPQKIRIASCDGPRRSSRPAPAEDADNESRYSGMLPAERPSGRKITLKRPSGDETSSSRTDGKKQRTAILWP